MNKTSKEEIKKNLSKKAVMDAKARAAALELVEEEEIAFDEALEAENMIEEENEPLPDYEEVEAADDIFERGAKFTKQGIPIKYIVKRNGELIGTQYHPFSWDQIQRKFKGGQYNIVAKTVSDNRYKGQETLSITDPIENNFGVEPKEPKEFIAPVQQAPAQPGFMEIFALVNKMSEDKARDVREQALSKSSESSQFMMAFLEMNKAASAQAQIQAHQTQTMMLEIAKMNQITSEKLAASQAMVFEKMESRFEKIIETVRDKDSHKEKPMSAIEMITLINASKNEGFELFSQMTEMANAKAEERIAQMEENNSNNREKPQSMTDKLIESVLPAIATSLASQAGSIAKQPERRALPVTQNPNTDRQVQPQNRTIQNQNQANLEARRQQQNGGNQNKSGVSRNGARSNNQINVKKTGGLATVDFGSAQANVEPVKHVSPPEYSIELQPEHTLDQFMEILAPTIGQAYVNQSPIAEAAGQCVETLKKSAISVKTFLKSVSNDDIIKIVETYGLPENSKEWFNALYANIKTIAGMDAG